MRNGRPHKTQTREIVKHIRYSAEEWNSVQEKVKLSGLSFSEFVRKATDDVKITPVNISAVRELRDVRNELVRIGTNINTIARYGAAVMDGISLNYFIGALQHSGDVAKELSVELDKIRNTMI